MKEPVKNTNFTQTEIEKMVKKAAFEAWEYGHPMAVTINGFRNEKHIYTIPATGIDYVDDVVIAIVLSDGSCQYTNKITREVTKIEIKHS